LSPILLLLFILDVSFNPENQIAKVPQTQSVYLAGIDMQDISEIPKVQVAQFLNIPAK
jgi:hypothetical protein